jgi:hypothetical protein
MKDYNQKKKKKMTANAGDVAHAIGANFGNDSENMLHVILTVLLCLHMY